MATTTEPSFTKKAMADIIGVLLQTRTTLKTPITFILVMIIIAPLGAAAASGVAYDLLQNNHQQNV